MREYFRYYLRFRGLKQNCKSPLEDGVTISEHTEDEFSNESPKNHQSQFLIKMMSKLGSTVGIDRVNVLVSIAHHYIHSEEWAKAILYLESALDFTENNNIQISQEELGKIRGGISYSLWKQGNSDQALNEAFLSTEILTIAKSKYLLSAKRHLAVVLIANQKYEEALRIFDEITLLDNYDFNDEIDLAKDNYHIGTALKALNKYLPANTRISQAKETYLKCHLIWMVMLCDIELTFNFFKLGNFEEAIRCGLDSFETAIFLENYEKAVEVALLIADIHIACSEIDRAIFQLKAAKEIYIKNETNLSSFPLIKIDHQIANLLEAEGKSKQATEIRQRSFEIQRITGDLT